MNKPKENEINKFKDAVNNSSVSSSISITKIDKNKFVSVTSKRLQPVINVKNEYSNKKENKCYDLNDYDYDYDYSDA